MAAGTPARRALAAATAALAVVLALPGCADEPGSSAPSRAPGPQELQAEAVATREFGLLSGGGWAQAWQLWSPQAQQAISRTDFVRLNTVCRPDPGVPYLVGASTRVDRNTVRVDWHHGDLAGSSTVVYRTGAWRFEPGPSFLADYRLGVAALVRKWKAAGSCR